MSARASARTLQLRRLVRAFGSCCSRRVRRYPVEIRDSYYSTSTTWRCRRARASRSIRDFTCSVDGERSIPSGLQVLPKSRWSTSVVASTSSSPSSSRTGASNESGTFLPAASSSPRTRSVSLSASVTSFAVKRTCGCGSKSKKSLERRCLSRLGFPVSRLPASMISSTARPSGPTV
jgi:hypothetical protein